MTTATYPYMVCRSHQVICGNIESIMLGMPGNALSDNSLADADLPHVEDMVNDSLNSCCIFKRQAPVPDPAPPTPFPNKGAEDSLQDLDTGDCADHAVSMTYQCSLAVWQTSLIGVACLHEDPPVTFAWDEWKIAAAVEDR